MQPVTRNMDSRYTHKRLGAEGGRGSAHTIFGK